MKTEKNAGGRKTFPYFKVLCLVIALVLAFFAGREFYELRHFKETVVSAPA